MFTKVGLQLLQNIQCTRPLEMPLECYIMPLFANTYMLIDSSLLLPLLEEVGCLTPTERGLFVALMQGQPPPRTSQRTIDSFIAKVRRLPTIRRVVGLPTRHMSDWRPLENPLKTPSKPPRNPQNLPCNSPPIDPLDPLDLPTVGTKSAQMPPIPD